MLCVSYASMITRVVAYVCFRRRRGTRFRRRLRVGARFAACRCMAADRQMRDAARRRNLRDSATLDATMHAMLISMMLLISAILRCVADGADAAANARAIDKADLPISAIALRLAGAPHGDNEFRAPPTAARRA